MNDLVRISIFSLNPAPGIESSLNTTWEILKHHFYFFEYLGNRRRISLRNQIILGCCGCHWQSLCPKPDYLTLNHIPVWFGIRDTTNQLHHQLCNSFLTIIGILKLSKGSGAC